MLSQNSDLINNLHKTLVADEVEIVIPDLTMIPADEKDKTFSDVFPYTYYTNSNLTSDYIDTLCSGIRQDKTGDVLAIYALRNKSTQKILGSIFLKISTQNECEILSLKISDSHQHDDYSSFLLMGVLAILQQASIKLTHLTLDEEDPKSYLRMGFDLDQDKYWDEKEQCGKEYQTAEEELMNETNDESSTDDETNEKSFTDFSSLDEGYLRRNVDDCKRNWHTADHDHDIVKQHSKFLEYTLEEKCKFLKNPSSIYLKLDLANEAQLKFFQKYFCIYGLLYGIKLNTLNQNNNSVAPHSIFSTSSSAKNYVKVDGQPTKRNRTSY